jgi:hypothetical protein
MTKDLTDDELIARITETYGLTRYGGDVAELVRRYRDSSFRLSRIANEARKPLPVERACGFPHDWPLEERHQTASPGQIPTAWNEAPVSVTGRCMRHSPGGDRAPCMSLLDEYGFCLSLQRHGRHGVDEDEETDEVKP